MALFTYIEVETLVKKWGLFNERPTPEPLLQKMKSLACWSRFVLAGWYRPAGQTFEESGAPLPRQTLVGGYIMHDRYAFGCCGPQFKPWRWSYRPHVDFYHNVIEHQGQRQFFVILIWRHSY